MRLIGWMIFGAASVFPVAAAALPAAADDGRLRQCHDVIAYLSDESRGGREVRSAPNIEAPVVGRILEPWTDGQATFDVSFSLNQTKDGWLYIDGAGDDPELTGVDREMYHGSGWIRGEGVTVGIQSSQGFAEPRFSSDIIIRTDANQMDMMEAVLACEGNWILARYGQNEWRTYRHGPEAVVSRNPLVLQAWVTGICNIQETSCDMASGDRPEE